MFRWISNERARQILSHVQPHLEEGEEVTHWVRARDPNGRRRGFAYLTKRRFHLHWIGQEDGGSASRWNEVEAWGINQDTADGPVLGVDTAEERHRLRLPLTTRPMVESAGSFVRRFCELAPKPTRRVDAPDGVSYQPEGEVDLIKQRRTALALTKRIAITVLGLALVALGALLTPVPGPWSFPVILAGLAVLASEYDWAEDTLDWVKDRFQAAAAKLRRRRASND